MNDEMVRLQRPVEFRFARDGASRNCASSILGAYRAADDVLGIANSLLGKPVGVFPKRFMRCLLSASC